MGKINIISKEHLKKLLKPNKKKVLASLVLVLLFLSPILLMSLLWFPSNVARNPIIDIVVISYFIIFFVPIIVFLGLGSWIVFSIMLLLLALTAYLIGCYIVESKEWLKGAVLFVVSIWVIGLIAMSGIGAYNEAFGHSCQTDEDCIFICGSGAVNRQYIPLRDPFIIIDCFETYAVCENNRCKAVSPAVPKSERDCELLKNFDRQDKCYYNLAEIYEQFRNEKTCEKIKDAQWKNMCYGLLQENKNE